MIEVSDEVTTVAGTPPNVTALTPSKFEPEIVTEVPAVSGPAFGVRPVTVGGAQ